MALVVVQSASCETAELKCKRLPNLKCWSSHILVTIKIMNHDVEPTKTLPEMNSPDSPSSTSSSEEKIPSSKISSMGVAALFVLLIIWCLVIAIGSFQTQASTDYRRPLIVILTMGTFLGILSLIHI